MPAKRIRITPTEESITLLLQRIEELGRDITETEDRIVGLSIRTAKARREFATAGDCVKDILKSKHGKGLSTLCKDI